MSQKNSYEKVIKKFLILLGLLFLSPFILSLGIKAVRIYTKGIGLIISYIALAFGIFLIIYTVYFGFKTFQTLMKTIFRNKN